MTNSNQTLARRLGTGDAVAIGLGSMIGAGIFVTLGPAARVAGGGLLIGFPLASAVTGVVVISCSAAVYGLHRTWSACRRRRSAPTP